MRLMLKAANETLRKYFGAVASGSAPRTARSLLKAGEGSRGGKVIGHTRSGKPIYAGHGAPDTRGSEGPDTWTDRDHEDAAGTHVAAMQRAGNDAAATEHHRAWAQYHHGQANAIRRGRDGIPGSGVRHVHTLSPVAEALAKKHEAGMHEREAAAQSGKKPKPGLSAHEAAYSAGTDVANKRMRSEGRTKWGAEDFNAAAAKYAQVHPPPPFRKAHTLGPLSACPQCSTGDSLLLKADVKEPGKRGGRGYRTKTGKWHYGEKGTGAGPPATSRPVTLEEYGATADYRDRVARAHAVVGHPQAAALHGAAADRLRARATGFDPAKTYAYNGGAGGITFRCGKHVAAGMQYAKKHPEDRVDPKDWVEAPGERCENCAA